MKRYRFAFKVYDCQATPCFSYGTIWFTGKSYRHARYRAERYLQHLNKRDPDVHYTLLKPKRKTFFDSIVPLLRWLWYFLGVIILALLFWLLMSYFYKG
jgi:hypothetical protein